MSTYTATQLKTLADAAATSLPQTYVDNLMPLLHAAAANGLYTYTIPTIANGSFKTAVNTLLSAQQYTVTESSPPDGTTTINWVSPT